VAVESTVGLFGQALVCHLSRLAMQVFARATSRKNRGGSSRHAQE
jgi:hypothetical protein